MPRFTPLRKSLEFREQPCRVRPVGTAFVTFVFFVVVNLVRNCSGLGHRLPGLGE